MTQSIRMIVALIALVLTGGGYVASQLAAIKGNQSAFALQMDQPPVRMLAAVVFIGALILAFVPDRNEGES